jgi:DNA mismatch repair ATPase MutL
VAQDQNPKDISSATEDPNAPKPASGPAPKTSETSETSGEPTPTAQAKETASAPASPAKKTTSPTRPAKTASSKAKPSTKAKTPKKPASRSTTTKKPAAKSASAAKAAPKTAAVQTQSPPKTANPQTANDGAANHGAANHGPAAADSPQNDEQRHSQPHMDHEKTFHLDWLWRALAVLSFGFISYILLVLAWVLAAVQYGVIIIRGEKNQPLSNLMQHLNAYLSQILGYLGGDTKATDLPFPFSDLPMKSEADSDQSQG